SDTLDAVAGSNVVSAVLAEPVTVAAALDTDGAWHAAASARVVVGGLPDGFQPNVRAELAGSGLSYTGQAVLADGSVDLAVASLAGQAADLRADLDLGTVAWSALADAF